MASPDSLTLAQPTARTITQLPWRRATIVTLAVAAVGALRPSAALFSASCAVLAIGSFLFHAAVTTEFQWLDMVGTYAALIAAASLAAAYFGFEGARSEGMA